MREQRRGAYAVRCERAASTVASMYNRVSISQVTTVALH